MATGYSRSLEGGHDAKYDFCCTPCTDDNLNAEASFYCRNCSKLFCDMCLKYHDKIHKGHLILGRKEVTKWGKVKSEIHSLMCEEHPGKEEEMYCADHGLTCCLICINVYHRACKEVRHVSEVAKGIQKTPEFQSFLTNATSTQTSLKNILDKRAQNIKLLQRTHRRILSSFKDIRKIFNQFMDNVEKESTTEMDKLLSILKMKIQSDIITCSDFEKEIQRFLHDIKEFGSQCNEFAFQCFNRCMKKLSSAEELLSSMKDEDYQLKFTPDPSIKQFQSALQTFGKFEITPMNLPTDYVYIVDKMQKYNIRTKTDKMECDISGICQLSDGQVAIVDSINQKVKLLCSSEYSVIDELELPQYPCDICTTTGTELVVTVCPQPPDKSWLHFINAADGHLTQTRTKVLDHPCYGIACHNGQLYVGSDTALYRYSLGQKPKKIYEDVTYSGLSVYRFTVSDDGKRIYITNLSQSCLLTLDKSGQKLSVLSNPELQKPKGVCLADNSTVFVCGYNSQTVIQVNSEGKMATLAKQSDGVNNPKSLCFDRKLQQPLLGQGKCDNLLLLKLK